MMHTMTPIVFRTFLLLLCHWYNVLVSDSGNHRYVPSRRQRGLVRELGVTAPLATSSSDSATLLATETMSNVNPIRLFRNPDGVGIFGSGKFHWDADLGAARPPCKRVWRNTLTEKRDVLPGTIVRDALYDLVAQSETQRDEMCTVCVQALVRAGKIQV